MRLLFIILSSCLIKKAYTETKLIPIYCTKGDNIILNCFKNADCFSEWYKKCETFYATISDGDKTKPSFPIEKYSLVGNTSTREYKLQIHNVSGEDEGVYICHEICQKNGTFHQRKTGYHLAISDRHYVTIEYKNFTDKSENKTMKCIPVGDSDSHTMFYWEHRSDFGKLIRSVVGSPDGLLTLPNGSPNYYDSGFYICYVGDENTHRLEDFKKSLPVYLTVSGKPVFTSTNKRKKYVSFDMEVDIKVDIFSSPKYSTLTIKNKGGELLKDGLGSISISESRVLIRESVHGSVITTNGYRVILNLGKQWSQMGTTYTFFVENDLGASNLTVTLEIEDTKSSPMKLKIILPLATGSMIVVFLCATSLLVHARRRRESVILNNPKDEIGRKNPVHHNEIYSIRSDEHRNYSTQQYQYENLKIECHTFENISNRSEEYVNTVYGNYKNQDNYYGNIDEVTLGGDTASMHVPADQWQETESFASDLDVLSVQDRSNPSDRIYTPLQHEGDERLSIYYDPLQISH